MDAQFDEAVGEEDAGTLLDVFSEGLEGGADQGRSAGNFARGDGEALAGLEQDWLVIFELGGADFWALEIAENAERLALFTADFADHLDQGQLFFVGAMGKVEADDVDAGANQIAEDGLGVGCRPEGSDDLCPALRRRLSQIQICEGHDLAPIGQVRERGQFGRRQSYCTLRGE